MPLAANNFTYVQTLVRSQSAIELEPRQAYLVEARLAPLLRGEGLGCVAELVTRLRAGAANGLHQRVVEAMTINETSFFRDVHPFEALQQHVLPQLLQRRAAQQSLTIWCAACSSGQEPYSIAMLLRDRFPSLRSWTVRIVAPDISNEMLARARAGRFSQIEVNRGLPAAMLVKHFTRQGTEWKINDDLRQLVDVRYLNLMQPWGPLPAADIIFMRNVLIYFGVRSKQQVLAQVRRVLRPDGALFLGGAETTMNLDDKFCASRWVTPPGTGCAERGPRCPSHKSRCTRSPQTSGASSWACHCNRARSPKNAATSAS